MSEHYSSQLLPRSRLLEVELYFFVTKNPASPHLAERDPVVLGRDFAHATSACDDKQPPLDHHHPPSPTQRHHEDIANRQHRLRIIGRAICCPQIAAYQTLPLRSCFVHQLLLLILCPFLSVHLTRPPFMYFSDSTRCAMWHF